MRREPINRKWYGKYWKSLMEHVGETLSWISYSSFSFSICGGPWSQSLLSFLGTGITATNENKKE